MLSKLDRDKRCAMFFVATAGWHPCRVINPTKLGSMTQSLQACKVCGAKMQPHNRGAKKVYCSGNCRAKAWRKENPEKLKVINKRNYDNRKDDPLYKAEAADRHARWIATASPEQLAEVKERKTVWRENNPEYSGTYQYERASVDIGFKLRGRISARIRNALKKDANQKAVGTIKLLGCTVQKAKEHIENQFLPGMSWENWGKHTWHIDHIRPCASFDLTDPEQQKQCFHYTNLQPLWASDNLRKSDSWDGGDESIVSTVLHASDASDRDE